MVVIRGEWPAFEATPTTWRAQPSVGPGAGQRQAHALNRPRSWARTVSSSTRPARRPRTDGHPESADRPTSVLTPIVGHGDDRRGRTQVAGVVLHPDDDRVRTAVLVAAVSRGDQRNRHRVPAARR